jgi:hypothetical protein
LQERSVPNFFVVGAPKAGTTSLYFYLDQHPSVYMSPIKEPCFFAPEVVDFTPQARLRFVADGPALQAYLEGPMKEKRSTGITLEWEQYLKLFKHVRDESAVGEVSGNYFGSSGAPAAIRTRIPHARIIMMLRDPVDRLFSQYAGARATGVTSVTFGQWVAEQMSAEAERRPPFGPVWTGKYAVHLKRYLDCFPPAQVHVCLYDDYARAPETTLRELFTFLGVDPNWQVDVKSRHNVTLVPRWPVVHRLLSPSARRAVSSIVPTRIAKRARARYFTRTPLRPTREERAWVIQIYQDDIRTLEGMLQRDLSAWLTRELA